MPYFSMSKDELLSDGSAACRKELKRRGRCGKTGVKLSWDERVKAKIAKAARAKAKAKKTRPKWRSAPSSSAEERLAKSGYTRAKGGKKRRRATDGQERYPDYVEDALEDSYEM